MTEDTLPSPYDRMVPTRESLDMGTPLPPTSAHDAINFSAFIDEISERIGYCQNVINAAAGLQGESDFKAEWRFNKAVREHPLPAVQYAHAQVRALQKLQDEALRVYAARFLTRPAWREELSFWWWRVTHRKEIRQKRDKSRAGAGRI